jgi:hypothetical protein
LKGGHTYKQRNRVSGTRVSNIINIRTLENDPVPFENTPSKPAETTPKSDKINIVRPKKTPTKSLLMSSTESPAIIPPENTQNLDFTALEDFVLSRV